MATRIHVKTRDFDKFAAVLGAKTQTDKAALLGLDISALSRIWNGERGPGEVFIAAAMTTFPGLDFFDLFEIRDETDGEPA
jgi:transcriptional regulator with XRE-family HTH domain